ncbi:TetR/AcrR family transcriptional regulator [Ramlibacter sp. G-1-2-2]|uniref:TetR/AcrR family transcriptional regulator n=1 Tax=Ramlibacter agri TaxID=2728837 RepID=A0A848GXM6_9BURK|nr:TetR/AcrR family transcriptional regulator [Ramlibacter agri]NML42907.1 TetR/AcrR family transcriptional regulator [Ramlibacter agri]
MGRGRSSTYEDQREMILERAAALFARGGYPGTSMNQVAEACGLSKATLYHYYRDKYALLVSIADAHVTRLQALVRDVLAAHLPPEDAMRELIARLVEEYAHAQNAHRVLTEDVKFLVDDDRERILDKEREVVRGFAQVVTGLRPDLQHAAMSKPLTMLLFGMINWMFTWMKPDGPLDYEAMAPVVADLFLGGIGAVETPAVTVLDS